MSLVQLYVPSEAAHATVEELGELKRVIEFRDVRVVSSHIQSRGAICTVPVSDTSRIPVPLPAQPRREPLSAHFRGRHPEDQRTGPSTALPQIEDRQLRDTPQIGRRCEAHSPGAIGTPDHRRTRGDFEGVGGQGGHYGGYLRRLQEEATGA